MRKGAFLLVGLLAVSSAAEGASVRFVWRVAPGIVGYPAVPSNYTVMNEGDTFKWEDVQIPSAYQAFAGYWRALGSSSVSVSSGAIHQDITIVITLSPGQGMMFGHQVALKMDFDVYDGIIDGTSVEGLQLLNPPGTHFYFDRPDGLVLYFDITPEFESAFLEPIGLSRDDITLAFLVGEGFSGQGMEVVPTYDGTTLTGLTGKISQLSTVVLVDKGAVEATEVIPSTWAKIKELWR